MHISRPPRSAGAVTLVTILELAEISGNVYEDTTIGVGGWKRHNRMPPMKTMSGFFGAAYFNPALSACVLAYRGSEFGDFKNDWVLTDGRIGAGQLPLNQVSDAFDYAGQVKRFAASLGCGKLYVTGHSLGGGLTSIVAGNLSNTIGVTFNAPGMKALRSAVRFRMHNPNVLNFRASDDPVSRVGEHIGHAPISLAVTSAAVQVASILSPAIGTAVSGYSHMIGPLIDALRAHRIGKRSPETFC